MSQNLHKRDSEQGAKLSDYNSTKMMKLNIPSEWWNVNDNVDLPFLQSVHIVVTYQYT